VRISFDLNGESVNTDTMPHRRAIDLPDSPRWQFGAFLFYSGIRASTQGYLDGGGDIPAERI